MSPTIHRPKVSRLDFNSNEETLMHVHIESERGKTKFWLEPIIALSEYHGLKTHELNEIEQLVEENQEKFINEWNKHFPK